MTERFVARGFGPGLPAEGAPVSVRIVGAKLVAAKPTPYHYRFHLANDQSVNAFAMLAQDQADLPGALSMLSTHPASDERAAQLQALLKDAPSFPALDAGWPAIRNAVSK